MTQTPQNPVQNNSALIPFPPRPEPLLERVKALCANSSNVRWSRHAQDCMAERGITIREALTVLQKGRIKGPIETGAGPGEWKVKIVRQIQGRRDVGVVAILVKESSVFVKTVEWEDIK